MSKRFACIALFVTFAGSALGQTAFVSGFVRAENGAAVPGAVIAAYTLDGAAAPTAVSDASGRYTLSLPAASYRLLAFEPNGTFATEFWRDASSFETSAVVDLAPGANLQNVDFRLRAGLVVSGMISAPAMDSLVVAAYNPDGTRRGFAKAASDGSYSFVLPAGVYKFAAYDELGRFTVDFYSGKVNYALAETVSVNAPRSGINFTLRPAGRVVGRVVDRETGQPVPEIRVEAFDMSGLKVAEDGTRSDGTYSLSVPPGTVKFVAFDRQSRYLTSYHRNAANFSGAASYSVTAGQTLSGIDFQIAKKVDPPRETTLWISAAANSPGAGGTFFQTDVWIFNPNDVAATIRVAFLPAGSDNRNRPTVDVVVPPASQREIRNVLQTLFSLSGAGALRMTSSSPFTASSRTFNKPANADVIGTFGLAIPALDLAESMSRGFLSGISSNSDARTNIGFVNPQATTIDVRTDVFSAQGTTIGSFTKRLEPHEWFQGNLFALIGAGTPVNEAYALVSSTGGSFFAYVSVVDAKSGDGTIVLPARDPRPGQPLKASSGADFER